jgi:Protein of unknown function (DUF3175)
MTENRNYLLHVQGNNSIELQRSNRMKKKRWSQKVKTVSTFPPKGLFTKNAEAIARSLASKKVSPKGIGSGIKMLQFFINRAGKTLSAARRRELEKAKTILREKAGHEK